MSLECNRFSRSEGVGFFPARFQVTARILTAFCWNGSIKEASWSSLRVHFKIASNQIMSRWVSLKLAGKVWVLTRSIKTVKRFEVTIDSIHLSVEVRLLASSVSTLWIENLDGLLVSLAHLERHILVIMILHATLIRYLHR